MVAPIEVTDRNFEKLVVESDLPVLVDFWAPWCGPCRMVGPLIEELAGEYDGRVKVAKLDTQANPQVPMTLGVRSIPAVILFDGPDVVDAIIGAQPKAAFAAMIDRYLKKRDKQLAKEDKRRVKQEAKEARVAAKQVERTAD